MKNTLTIIGNEGSDLRRISVNCTAVKLVKKLCGNAEAYGVIVKENETGTHIIDAGIKAEGGFLAGKAITEICLGGLGEATLTSMKMGDLVFPAISVYTDNPAVATLGSQLAGWRIKSGDYSAVASGPARALALKPKSVFSKIGYEDRFDEAVLVFETSSEPPSEVVADICESCHVAPNGLHLILVPTQCVAGFTQVSGRIAETGIHKLSELGFDPKLVMHAWGYAPIMPVHPDSIEAMGRTNDAILYGGIAYYTVSYDNDEELKELTKQSASSASKQYGRPFADIFREAGQDFYKIDPGLFAPAKITINNVKTGRTFTAGKTDIDVLMRSIGLKRSDT
jgi:methenyltetrahydromethanopterin cyclohydrolase